MQKIPQPKNAPLSGSGPWRSRRLTLVRSATMDALSYYGIAASLRPWQGSAKLMKFCTDMPAHMRL